MEDGALTSSKLGQQLKEARQMIKAGCTSEPDEIAEIIEKAIPRLKAGEQLERVVLDEIQNFNQQGLL